MRRFVCGWSRGLLCGLFVKSSVCFIVCFQCVSARAVTLAGSLRGIHARATVCWCVRAHAREYLATRDVAQVIILLGVKSPTISPNPAAKSRRTPQQQRGLRRRAPALASRALDEGECHYHL